jgi:hypothetical protein
VSLKEAQPDHTMRRRVPARSWDSSKVINLRASPEIHPCTHMASILNAILHGENSTAEPVWHPSPTVRGTWNIYQTCVIGEFARPRRCTNMRLMVPVRQDTFAPLSMVPYAFAPALSETIMRCLACLVWLFGDSATILPLL